MSDIEIDGNIYSTDALCVFCRDDGSGDWQASLHDYHHAIAHTPRMAVLKLASYLKNVNIDEFYKNKHHFDAWMELHTKGDG